MHLVLLLAASALLCGAHAANLHREIRLLQDIDNHIEHNGLPKTTSRRFVSITHKPKASYGHKQGDMIQLSCEALGVPAPSIRWFKNDVPVYEYDMESNELIDSNPTSMARVWSTLLVSRSSGRDRYSCLATAGSNTARASTVVINTDGSTEVTERSKLYPLSPEVVVWYKIYVDSIGSNVVLPCRVKGHPRPFVTWTDNKGNLVKNGNRMKVLRSGELVITSLRWSDMGEYRCHAANTFGIASAETFLYPAKAT